MSRQYRADYRPEHSGGNNFRERKPAQTDPPTSGWAARTNWATAQGNESNAQAGPSRYRVKDVEKPPVVRSGWGGQSERRWMVPGIQHEQATGSQYQRGQDFRSDRTLDRYEAEAEAVRKEADYQSALAAYSKRAQHGVGGLSDRSNGNDPRWSAETGAGQGFRAREARAAGDGRDTNKRRQPGGTGTRSQPRVEIERDDWRRSDSGDVSRTDQQRRSDNHRFDRELESSRASREDAKFPSVPHDRSLRTAPQRTPDEEPHRRKRRSYHDQSPAYKRSRRGSSSGSCTDESSAMRNSMHRQTRQTSPAPVRSPRETSEYIPGRNHDYRGVGRCTNCGSVDHHVNRCRARNGPSNASPLPCPGCGSFGHDQARCPVECFKCGRRGHKSAMCSSVRMPPRNGLHDIPTGQVTGRSDESDVEGTRHAVRPETDFRSQHPHASGQFEPEPRWSERRRKEDRVTSTGLPDVLEDDYLSRDAQPSEARRGGSRRRSRSRSRSRGRSFSSGSTRSRSSTSTRSRYSRRSRSYSPIRQRTPSDATLGPLADQPRPPEFNGSPEASPHDDILTSDLSKINSLRATLAGQKRQFDNILAATQSYLQNAFKIMMRINPSFTMDTSDFLQQTFGRRPQPGEVQAVRILQGQQIIISAQREQLRQLETSDPYKVINGSATIVGREAGDVSGTVNDRNEGSYPLKMLDAQNGKRSAWKSISGTSLVKDLSVVAAVKEPSPLTPPTPPTSAPVEEPPLRQPAVGSEGAVANRLDGRRKSADRRYQSDVSLTESQRLRSRSEELSELVASAPTAHIVGPGEVYEKLGQVGEGTYGKVYKARSERSGILVALKRIRMEGEKDGFPVTAMREIKLLQGLNHGNVVKLHEIMVATGSVYMVSEYMHHDLTGVLSQSQFVFSPANLKSLCEQMLAGLAYLHGRSILHRDLKGSNILLNNRGELKLADFGLARLFNKRREMDFTNRVITLWYRSPELLMGETVYGPGVDMWSAGCIMLELFTRKPVLQGNDEIHQLEVIYSLLGTPAEHLWPGLLALPWYELVKPRHASPSRFVEQYGSLLTIGAREVAAGLLEYDPSRRLTAEAALDAPYFRAELPPAQRPVHIAKVKGEWHEMEAKMERAMRKHKELAGLDTS